jgi:hypothetical protein
MTIPFYTKTDTKTVTTSSVRDDIIFNFMEELKEIPIEEIIREQKAKQKSIDQIVWKAEQKRRSKR